MLLVTCSRCRVEVPAGAVCRNCGEGLHPKNFKHIGRPSQVFLAAVAFALALLAMIVLSIISKKT